MLPRQLADGLEVAGLGEHDPEVHHRRLHDHAGRLAPLLDQAFDAALHRGRVVERHRDRQVGDDLRDPPSVRQRLEVVAEADAVVRDADRDHHVVVVAVVGAEDLDDRVAAGRRAGDPDRVHRRLGARVRVAPPRQAPAARELLGHDDSVLGRARRSASPAGSAPRSPCRSPGARGPAPSSRSRCGSRASRSRPRPTPSRRRRGRGRSATGRAPGRRRRRPPTGSCGRARTWPARRTCARRDASPRGRQAP